MTKANIPDNEYFRLKELYSYEILNSTPEKDFDDLTKIASQICRTPISLITLIDKETQWFKSHYGTTATGTERKLSFCTHAIDAPTEILKVYDARLDPRFQNNPLVTGGMNVIFYAGVPLVTPSGHPLGTLCVIDHKPNDLDEDQTEALRSLANQVVKLLELRKNKLALERINEELRARNEELNMFAYVAAHDIKSPLRRIAFLTDMLTQDYSKSLDQEGLKLLALINRCSNNVQELVEGILAHSKGTQLLKTQKEEVDIVQFLKDIIELLPENQLHIVNLHFEPQMIMVNKVALQQIFINLITNAIKYNDKEKVVIDINFTRTERHYQFSIKDNGIGIAEEDQAKIYTIFEVLKGEDRFGSRGYGIGLSTVKLLVEGLGGEISLQSKLKEGSTFTFSVEI